MTQADFLQFAQDLLDHWLEQFEVENRWDVGIDHAKLRGGACVFTSRRIQLSKHHIELNDKETVTDTILHEIAHAIAYEKHQDTGHGYHWQRIAQELGTSSEVRGNFDIPERPWILVYWDKANDKLVKVAERYRRNKKIKNFHLNGKPETMGRLYFIDADSYVQWQEGAKQIEECELYQ